MCDDGGAETRGVWQFDYNSENNLYVPGDAGYRRWSGGTCSDIVGQVRRFGDDRCSASSSCATCVMLLLLLPTVRGRTLRALLGRHHGYAQRHLSHACRRALCCHLRDRPSCGGHLPRRHRRPRDAEPQPDAVSNSIANQLTDAISDSEHDRLADRHALADELGHSLAVANRDALAYWNAQPVGDAERHGLRVVDSEHDALARHALAVGDGHTQRLLVAVAVA